MRVMAGALEGDLFIGPKAEVTGLSLSSSVTGELAAGQSNLFWGFCAFLPPPLPFRLFSAVYVARQPPFCETQTKMSLLRNMLGPPILIQKLFRNYRRKK